MNNKKQGRAMSKKYLLYGVEKNYSEVKSFIENYSTETKTNPKGRYNEVLKLIPPDVYVLDYGCGWGIFSEMMADKGCCVDAIDLDKYSIEIAKSFIGENDHLIFKQISINDVEDEKYDYVVSSQVIEHTHNPGNYLMECNRVIKTNGYLIISLPNIINPRVILTQIIDWKKKFTNHFKNYEYLKIHDHIQAWDPFSFMRLLDSMGFEFVSIDFIEGLPLPNNKYFRTIEIPRLNNLSRTMIFKVQKKKFVRINNND